MSDRRTTRSHRRHVADHPIVGDTDASSTDAPANEDQNDTDTVIMDPAPGPSSRAVGKQPIRGRHTQLPSIEGPETTGFDSSGADRALDIKKLRIDRKSRSSNLFSEPSNASESDSHISRISMRSGRRRRTSDIADSDVPNIDADVLLRQRLAASGKLSNSQRAYSKIRRSSSQKAHSDRGPASSRLSTPKASHFSTGQSPRSRFIPRMTAEEVEYALDVKKATLHIKRADAIHDKLMNDDKFESLKGRENYDIWRRTIIRVLKANSVSEIVLGDVILLPEDHRYYPLQMKFVSHARKIILSHVSKGISQYLEYNDIPDDPQTMWKALEQNYKPPPFIVAEEGIADFERCKFSNYDTFDEFKNAFQFAWTRIHNGIPDNERTKCIWFIRKLDSEKWQTWKTTFQSRLTASNNPDAELLRFGFIVSELENQTMRASSASSRAYSTSSNQKKQETQVPKCEHCKKKGHNDAKCWKKHPEKHPEWQKSREDGIQKTSMLTVTDKPGESSPALASTSLSVDSDIGPWVCDPGSDDHFISSPNHFQPGTTKPITIGISTLNGREHQQGLTGNVFITVNSGRKTRLIELCDVTWFPSVKTNLFSGNRISQRGITAIYRPQEVEFFDIKGHLITSGKKVGTQWHLNVLKTHFTGRESHVLTTECVERTQKADSDSPIPPKLDRSKVNFNTWHRRMMHLSNQGVERTAKITTGKPGWCLPSRLR